MMIQDLNTIREQEDILTGKLWHKDWFESRENDYKYERPEETIEEQCEREGWND